MMALLTFMPSDESGKQRNQKKKKKKKPTKNPSSSSWEQIKSLFTCKHIQNSTVHDPSQQLGSSSCSSICTLRDVVHGSTRVVHRADDIVSSSDSSTPAFPVPKNNSNNNAGTHTSMVSSRGRMPLRKLSGCYECRFIVDPARYPISPGATICACSECGELFPKLESLELHQAIRHAVSELGPEDSGRNIVEIIFKSSWLKKDTSICNIDRILKVRNTPRTIRRFEECRDAVKARAITAPKKNPRCAADGNELLRFHCATLTCALGARGSSSLCSASPAPSGGGACAVCAIIRHGFQGKGVRTTASSGKAHDCLGLGEAHGGCRAMLVCRVIAGRMRRVTDDAPLMEEEGAVGGGGWYDSVAGCGGASSNIEDLLVNNPRAILPCFVVIYKALQF